jgi:hypothetical protein
MYLGIGVADLFIEVAILVLPIHIACGLHLPTRTKVAVAGIFAIAQVLRIFYVYQPGVEYGEFLPPPLPFPLIRTKLAATVDFYEAEQWTNIHTALAIICASLPLYMPVIAETGHLHDISSKIFQLRSVAINAMA